MNRPLQSQFREIISDTQELLKDSMRDGSRSLRIDPDWLKTFGNRRTMSKSMDKGKALKELADRVAGCTECRLCEGRTQTVFGVGTPDADLMFVGEGPGAEEDRQGEPFVGRAGQLLTKIIQAMGLTREEVYIGNVVKCRPPENRNPMPDEMAMCEPYLVWQIEIINPKIIVAMGNTAVKCLLKTTTGITRLRGTFMEYQGIPLMPTFHPAALLRNPNQKKDVWEDMKKVLARLEELKED